MSDAIFVQDGDTFVPTEHSGSPWGETLVHGGPPAGLLARAIERFEPDPEMQLTRLTIDLFRPVPKAPLSVTTLSVRAGRRIHVVEAAITAGGIEVCKATGLLLRRSGVSLPLNEGMAMTPPGPEGIETSQLGRGMRDDRPPRPGFHTTIEARWVTQREEPGLQIAWLRLPLPLVPGEPLSPLVRIAATSDFINAIGSMSGEIRLGFINTDTTLYLHRYPEGEWIAFEVSRQLEPHGLGVSRATLFDQRGPVGTAVQAVLVNTMT